jgi:hypothetical protein
MTKEEFEKMEKDTSLTEHEKCVRSPHYFYLKHMKVNGEVPEYRQADADYFNLITKLADNDIEDIVNIKGMRGNYLLVKFKDEDDKADVGQGTKLVKS